MMTELELLLLFLVFIFGVAVGSLRTEIKTDKED